MAEVFHTSDHHFQHEQIVRLAERPFASIAEHDSALIDNWNDVVPKDGLVFHHGDFALGDRDTALREIVPRLNGRIVLITGNHDSCFPGATNGWKNTKKYLAAGFEAVVPFARVKLPAVVPGVAGRRVWLSHFPYDGDSLGNDRHTGSRLRDEGEPLLHGHVHGEYQVQKSAETGAIQINVGVDVWGFVPVPATALARLIHDLESEVS